MYNLQTIDKCSRLLSTHHWEINQSLFLFCRISKMMSREELDGALEHYSDNITRTRTFQRWSTAPHERPRRRDLLRISARANIPLGDFIEHLLGFPEDILTLDLGNSFGF